MRVFSRWFKEAREPVRLIEKPRDPWEPPECPALPKAQLLVAPDRNEARLVPPEVAALLDGHFQKVYLPNRGVVAAFFNQAAWEQALRIIDASDALAAIVKPATHVHGSGLTVFYPKGEDYGIAVDQQKEV